MDSSVAKFGRSKTPPPNRSVKFQLASHFKKCDSVDSLMDRIDQELGAMNIRIQTPRRCRGRRPWQRTRSLSRSVEDRMSSRWPANHSKTKSPLADVNGSDSGITHSLSTSSGRLRDASSSPFTDSYSSGDRACDKKFISASPTVNTHTETDALSVFPQTNHMNALPPSVRTEDINRDLLSNSITAALSDSADDVTGLDGLSVQSVDTPRTEDFESAFQASLVESRVVAGPTTEIVFSVPSDSDTINTEYIQRKLRQAGAGDIEGIFSSTTPNTPEEMSEVDREKSILERYRHLREPVQHYDASSESELDGDMARDIQEESTRIQKEIEMERKANRIRDSSHYTRESTPKTREITPKSQEATPKARDSVRHSTPSTSRYPTDINSNIGTSTANLSQFSAPSVMSSKSVRNGSVITLAEDGEIIEKLNNEKIRLLQEIRDLQQKMRCVEQDLTSTEKQAKENRNRAEEARSQLMLAEFKKDTALKEFTHLSSELERGRQLQASLQLESAQRIPITDLPQTSNAYGLTSAELSDLLSERNQLRDLVDNRNSNLHLEKNELERQLETTKQELFAEQRNCRQRVESLEAKLEDAKSQLHHVTTEKETKSLELDSYRAKNHKLEQNLREVDKSKIQAIMERDKELEVLKETSQREALEMKTMLNNELNNTKTLLKLSEEKCLKLQVEIQHREELNQDLREECSILHSKTADEEESHDQLLREMNRKLAALQDQKKMEMDVLRSQMEIEHLSVVEKTRADLEGQHEEVLEAMKQEYDSQLSQQQLLINGKEEEICLLRSRLTQQEEATRKLAERLKADTQIQLEQAVQNERHMWEKEHKYVEGSQLKSYREEAEKQQEQMKEQLECEQRRCRQLDDQYRALKSELEEQRNQNQRIYQEKMTAVSHSKQAAQEETNIQLEKIRQQLEEDTERVLDKLRSELTVREDEIRALRGECQTLQQQESDVSIALEKLEKIVVKEINDECRKTAHLLGVTPRKAQSSGFNSSSSPSRTGTRRRTRSITASAIANLRACNEELRNNVRELKEDVDALKTALYKAKKSKETEVEEVKKQMSKDKGHDMDDLRVRLTQIVSTQQSVLDLLELSASNLLEPDAQSTDVESDDCDVISAADSVVDISIDDCFSEHKAQIDHICTMLVEQSKLSRLVQTRDQELKDIHHNMSSWKDETANRMADKFTDELYNQLKVYLGRLERKLADNTFKQSLKDSATKSSCARDCANELLVDDLGASPQLRHRSVQSRIRQLKSRSPSRARVTSLSTPDLSLGHVDGASSAMEQRVKLAEMKAHLAEERAGRNQALLNQKLQEINHLQHTLNSQTKEIISLERSFEDLKQASFSPSRMASHHSMIP